MTTVFSAGPFRNVHSVNVESKNGRIFVIDIYQVAGVNFESTVTIFDKISTNPGSWIYETNPATTSANDNFNASIQLIQKYLAATDPTDTISDIHNPCNLPFVSEQDQNSILSSLKIDIIVRVN